jgi:hypothetical protein
VLLRLLSDSREDLKARVMAEVKAHFRCVTCCFDCYSECYFVICALSVWVVRLEVHLPSGSREDLKARVMAEVKAATWHDSLTIPLFLLFRCRPELSTDLIRCISRCAFMQPGCCHSKNQSFTRLGCLLRAAQA